MGPEMWVDRDDAGASASPRMKNRIREHLKEPRDEHRIETLWTRVVHAMQVFKSERPAVWRGR